MKSSNITTNHSEIRRWVEERGGWPARVIGTGRRGDPGMLRIDFPDYSGSSLEEISWNEFFDKFEKENLAFVYQDRKVNGEMSYFSKLVSADNYYMDSANGRSEKRSETGGARLRRNSPDYRRRSRHRSYSY